MSPRLVERGVYLDAYLRPLAAWLERPDVTDILINAPGEVWVETLGGEVPSRAQAYQAEALVLANKHIDNAMGLSDDAVTTL